MAHPPVPEEITMETRRILVDPGAPIKSAHNFGVARVGDNFQLDVGFFDLLNLKEAVDSARAGAEPAELHFIVTDRFALSRSSFEILARKVREIHDKIKNESEGPEGEDVRNSA